MSFMDRFSCATHELPDEEAHAGRWIVAPDTTMLVNRVDSEHGQALMPGPTGDWQVAKPGEFAPRRGGFLAEPLPSGQDVDSFRQLGQILRDKADGGWLKWSDTSPLAPGLNEAVRSHPFEGDVERELEHIEAVCRKPRTHIRLEVERELVARARRIARDAPQWLASHTEDWHRRTLTGVQPRRIRAEVREERWDLYENRVTARLVDNLAVWLRRRIAEVRRIRDDILSHMEEFDGSAPKGSRHRAHRIYRLWGEAWGASDAQEVAQSTLIRLEALLYKVLGLQDSPLYRHVPKQAQVPRTLKMTNLFNSDDHYRGVARLWHEWSLLPTRGGFSTEEHYQRQQDLHDSYNAWCLLLVVRACEQLKLQPADDAAFEAPLRKGCSVQLNRGLRIEWERTGSIAIARGEDTLAVFVPLIHALENARTPEALAHRVKPLVDAVAEDEQWTVVLHPANSGPARFDEIATVGNPPRPSTRGTIDFIRVSPFSLDSVERVARAIRWATLVPQMLAYPPCVPTPPDGDFTRPWLAKRNTGCAVVESPGVRGRSDVERGLSKARARLEELERKRDESQKRDESKKAGRSNKRVNKRAIDEARNEERDWREFKQSFGAATARIDELATCPRCGEQAAFEARDNDCFSARCSSESCKAVWELRLSSEGRIPVFMPEPDVPLGQVPAALIDEQLGCDVLALPKQASGGSVEFSPPRTVPWRSERPSTTKATGRDDARRARRR